MTNMNSILGTTAGRFEADITRTITHYQSAKTPAKKTPAKKTPAKTPAKTPPKTPAKTPPKSGSGKKSGKKEVAAPSMEVSSPVR